MALTEPVAPLEDAVELQYESNKLLAQGKFREALFVRVRSAVSAALVMSARAHTAPPFRVPRRHRGSAKR